ncbi:MAG: S41 family peptidase [Verrucomicrobia bacterium]|nr:S41 family peptidase [Verrucomicrobiota bacterium]
MVLKTLGRGVGWMALASLLAVNLVMGARLQIQGAATDDRDAGFEKIALFTRVLEQVREQYVDAGKTSYQELIYGALRGMLQSLDPHSQFLDPDMYKDMKDETAGEFGGLGIVIGTKDGMLTVIAPMEDTPGFKAGLLPGDKIMEIDGQSTDGVSLAEAVKKLRGAPGTKVTIGILRPKTEEIRTLELVRARINIPSVKNTELLDDGIGYLRIVQFNDPTAKAVHEAVQTLQAQGMRALVLDLRNNPGGLLTSAIEVAEKFVRRGDMIVFTQGRNEKPLQTFRAKGRTHYLDFPVVILINGASASAAEIVAGALQDQRRAILVGEKTFGKGSVQSVLQLDDGSAIRLTTAHYYTPSKRVIQEQGIEPDVVVPMPPEDWHQLMLQRATTENGAPKQVPEAARVKDLQLERALDILKGVMIFTAQQETPAMAMH